MIKIIGERACTGFLRWGWLLPAAFPLAQVLGRGAFNSLSGIYFLWALLALPGLRGGFPAVRREPFFLAYLALLGIWALSLTMAADPAKGAETLLRYIQYSLTGLFTYLALQQHADGPRRLLVTMAWGALLTVGVLLVQLPYYLWAIPFDPTQQLREDNLPWLLPFVLAALALGNRARVLTLVAVLAFAAYILLSQGRAALIGLIVALVVFGVLGYRLRIRTVLATALALLIAGSLLSERFFRGITGFQLDFATLDVFTSGRATIWAQALSMPPDNPWLGVGLGNVGSHQAVLQIGEAAVKHLHNFLIDAWFETGLLGLAALLTLLATACVPLVHRLSRLTPSDRLIAAAALAASCALLAAGLFSYSYTSRQFGLYLYLIFALMLALARQTDKRER